tara:strand:+ start:219 stop:599 length:381 start_codon:yes stop_codon:yes gene_type:complete
MSKLKEYSKEIETYTDYAQLYFKAWNEADLELLEEMFADDCLLRDWEISAEGKQDVLAANKGIFESVKSIRADVLALHESTWGCEGGCGIVIAELEIIVNEEEKLLVVDIIEINNNKIKSIKAYKG